MKFSIIKTGENHQIRINAESAHESLILGLMAGLVMEENCLEMSGDNSNQFVDILNMEVMEEE